MGRVGGLVAMALLAACYSPTAPSGAPCAAGGGERCPGGQTCELVGGVELCVVPGDVPLADAPGELDASAFDGGVDGPPDDLDNDGVPNLTDNCPLVDNPTQRNHDGDARGDACDGCPHLTSANPVDTDSDGVDDACDPHPMEPDRISLFEDFLDPLPATWSVMGPWEIQGGDANIVEQGISRYALAAPGVAADRAVVVTEVVPRSTFANESRGAGIALPLPRGGGDGGVGCQLMFTSNPLPRLALFDFQSNQILASTLYAWDPGRTYTLALLREGASYTCRVSGLATGTETISATRAVMVPEPAVGLRARGFSAEFDYLLVIEAVEN